MNRLVELRKKAGLSQIELGKKLNMAQNSISNWENGNREPDLDNLKILSSFFDVTIDYLLGNSDIPTSEIKLDEIEFALFGEVRELSDAQKRDILNFARFVKQQHEGK